MDMLDSFVETLFLVIQDDKKDRKAKIKTKDKEQELQNELFAKEEQKEIQKWTH